MNKGLVALAGIGVGAGIMYLVDPREGRRRRARVRELTIHSMHTVKTVAGVTSRDVEHRLSGLAAHMLGRLVEEETPSDDVLVARVRARLGRLVSHPGAIDVTASQGTVTVSGPIFEAEVEQLLEGIGAAPGVTAIENRLEPHREAGHVSRLQGSGPREVPRMPASWRRWSPTARLIAGVAGLALVALSSPNRPVRGAATGIAGVELLERALWRARERA
jgi:osmotically-inducible protein OsmY